jgi:conjugal transfer pilus assembly protein TraV
MNKILPFLIIFSLFFSGCFLNPYQSDFTCPHMENGKCVSVQSAYDESLETSKKKKADMSLQDELDDISKSGKAKTVKVSPATVSNYQDALYAKIAGLLNEPVTPMVAPPQVMRVLVFPYKGDGKKLFMPRYVFMFTDEAQWVLDEKAAVVNEVR